MNAGRFFITGASGALGYRLAEVLHEQGVEFDALVHRRGSAGLARLARLGCDVLFGDVTDRAAYVDRMRGCDVVVHCAFGSGGRARERRRVTVAGTKQVMKAACTAGVRRIIHISSSVVVDEGPNAPLIDENARYRRARDVYIDSKIAAERTARSFDQRLEVVVLRPTRIFGPYCTVWTRGPLESIRSGTAWLADGGPGLCPLVYIDNTVEAILLAATSAQAAGGVFFITDDEQVSWRRFYGDYLGMLDGQGQIHDVPFDDIARVCRNRPSTLRASLTGIPRAAVSAARASYEQVPAFRQCVDMAPLSVINAIKTRNQAAALGRSGGGVSSYVNGDAREALRWATANVSRTVVSTARLKERLGYRQVVSYGTAMNLTASWAVRAGWS